MRKGERTKELIRQRVAPLFNTYGIAGTTMNELVVASGMEKGGIYNHFANKEALALAAFEYATTEQYALFAAAVASTAHPGEQLKALIAVARVMYANPPIAGGCPVMNMAIETDDTYPVLREKTQQAMQLLLALAGSIVKAGIASGTFRNDIQPRQIATVLIALMEGGLMLSKLYHDPIYVERVVEQATLLIESFETKGGTSND